MATEPPVLQAYNGGAEVTHDGKPSSVDTSHLFFFSLELVTPVCHTVGSEFPMARVSARRFLSHVLFRDSALFRESALFQGSAPLLLDMLTQALRHCPGAASRT